MSVPVRRYRRFRAFLLACALVIIGIPIASLVTAIFPPFLTACLMTLYLGLGTLVIGAAPRRATIFYVFLFFANWIAGIGFAVALSKLPGTDLVACLWLFIPLGMTILLGTNGKSILASLRRLPLFQANRPQTRVYYQPRRQRSTPNPSSRSYEQGYQATQPRQATYEEGGLTYPVSSPSHSDQQEQPQAHYPTM
ncbi:hypothetical protein KSD_15490 [Ktedonobacter sp. SOSP1-85]|uniref:hypothetical protein n=1 Tax=Ktedonobacter sp. SOSP1-85 TaxID=2778367 RepID=UPI001916A190|nr:hypothetical protein [Ktedonobacter sp. SOSP1-85]GHO73778.1 hypothetical protein KSD_15490 [Ktedonobacter sp. SOSP1-85]